MDPNTHPAPHAHDDAPTAPPGGWWDPADDDDHGKTEDGVWWDAHTTTDATNAAIAAESARITAAHAESDRRWAAAAAAESEPLVVYLLCERWDDGTMAKSVWTSVEAAKAAWDADQAATWGDDESPIVPIEQTGWNLEWFGLDPDTLVEGMAWADGDDDSGAYVAWIERHVVRS